MKKELTYKQFLDDLKSESKEYEELLTVSENVAKIIAKLTKERIARDLTQRDLARVTGLKQPAIARLESLKSVPRLDTVLKIAYHLDLNLGFFDDVKREYIIIPTTTTPYEDQSLNDVQNFEDACTTNSLQTTYNYSSPFLV